jgi:hypothetical protein
MKHILKTSVSLLIVLLGMVAIPTQAQQVENLFNTTTYTINTNYYTTNASMARVIATRGATIGHLFFSLWGVGTNSQPVTWNFQASENGKNWKTLTNVTTGVAATAETNGYYPIALAYPGTTTALVPVRYIKMTGMGAPGVLNTNSLIVTNATLTIWQ